MTTITLPRGTGKTMVCIARAAETGYPILCSTSCRAEYIKDIAKREGYKDIKCIVPSSVEGGLDGYFKSKDFGKRQVIIDDADLFLSAILANVWNVKIDLMTVSQNLTF